MDIVPWLPVLAALALIGAVVGLAGVLLVKIIERFTGKGNKLY